MFETYKKNILDFYKRTKRMPSYAEIMDITGLKSKSPVFKLVNKLIEAGVVSKDENGRLIP
jgi:DNA-binding IclR family transcriptional regulator